MDPEILHRIMEKATSEFNVRFVHLYNWTEPFLHPKLSEMIRIVQSYNIGCGLSSNLNVMPNIEGVLAVNPDYLMISVSGFTQSIYEQTHRGGDIERVKQNMVTLAEAKSRMNSQTRIEVKYLIYLGNVDEAVLMKQFVESLGFSFTLSWAGLMPLEKLLTYVSNGSTGEVLTEEDRHLTDRLIFPHKELINLAKPYKKLPCLLLEEWIMINCKGDVQLCCMVYNESKYTIANYLTTPISKIQALKRAHWQCSDCIEYGIAAARNWPILNLNKFIMEKFTRYWASVGLDVSKIENYGPVRSRIRRSYQIYSARARRSPWLRKQYHRLRKIQSSGN